MRSALTFMAGLFLALCFVPVASANDWQPIPGRLKYVSATGPQAAWGVNAANEIYRTVDAGSNWTKVSGKLTQVSARDMNHAWGVNAAGAIYRTNDGGKNWILIPGSLTHVSMVAHDIAWGINAAGGVFHTKDAGKSWHQVPGRLVQVSGLSYEGAWGVNSAGNVYRTINGGKAWEQVSGSLAHVSATSPTTAWGVNRSGAVFRTQDGGKTWNSVAGSLKQISALNWTSAWGVNAQDAIYRMTAAADNSGQPKRDVSATGTFCANEGGFCFFSGPADVNYGANGKWKKQFAQNGVACNNARFADPNPGVLKACYFTRIIQEPASTSSSINLDMTPKRISFEKWIGTAPSCNASPRDCTNQGMEYVRSDKSGGGSKCWTGTKVLCRGWRDAPTTATKDVWLGTAPSCNVSAQDCTKLGMTFVRSDKSGDGSACVTGTKVLCTAPRATIVREWVGTAPFCSASADDCVRRGLNYVRSDKTGDGKACTSGTKVLCEGKAGDYKPQATGLTDSINQVVSDLDIATVTTELKRKTDEILPSIKWKIDLVTSHLTRLQSDNPMIYVQAIEAFRRGDQRQAYALLQLPALVKEMQQPPNRLARIAGDYDRWPKVETILAPKRASMMMQSVNFASQPHANFVQLRGRPATMHVSPTSGWAFTTAHKSGFSGQVELAQANTDWTQQTKKTDGNFTHMIIGWPGGSVGLGVGAFIEAGSASRYTSGKTPFVDAPSEDFSRYGYTMPAIGVNFRMTIGEWKCPAENDSHGIIVSAYYLYGFAVGLWFDYEGNLVGWTVSPGAGLGTEGVYARQRGTRC